MIKGFGVVYCDCNKLRGENMKQLILKTCTDQIKDYYYTKFNMVKWMVKNESTLRETVKQHNGIISKTTLHNYITKELKFVDHYFYKMSKLILEKNKIERTFRGGEQTKKKYKELKDNV